MQKTRKPRFQTRDALPVRISSGGQSREGRMLNLSEGGAFIIAETDVWIGEEVKLELDIPEVGPEGHISLRALTVWCTESKELTDSENGRGYGLLFLPQKHAGPSMSQRIQNLLDAGLLLPMKRAG